MSTTCTPDSEILQASLLDLEPITSRLSRHRRDNRNLPSVGFFSTATPRQERCGDDSPKRVQSATWMEKLWGSGATKGSRPLQPKDLPGHDELADGTSMFNSRRILTSKAASEPRLRCTEVDEDGEVILVDGEFKKMELIAKVGSPLPGSEMLD